MRVLMTGGGTAGHINPALAIADKIKKEHPDAEILFVGAKGRMETRLVPAAGYPIRTETVRGFQRQLTLKNIGLNMLAAINVVTSGVESDRILKEFRPDIAIGTGGYVCGPILRKAIKRGIPVVVHESNAFPGMTVKMLAKEGATVLLCSEKARQHLPQGAHAVVTGNPLRPDFLTLDKVTARRTLGVDERPLVLSFGGSLGAQHINDTMAQVLSLSHQRGALQHIHGTGRAGFAAMKQQLDALGVPLHGDGIAVREYIDDMPVCMAAADLVICRCGAMTLSELPAAGKPSILIPSPYVAENHQYHNAMVLVEQGAAVCIEEKDLTAERLWATIEEITANRDRLQQMSDNVRQAAILDADERIYRVIRETLQL
ncbi:MAG: undecaprenyldiphospho-muramoylpentapeptide beta-N-acetylglucosaminyltransferase [Ruminococcaceae bacterium]|nr:undecaprenyldiphospho-muramoylpentapeptide beta-N-acetylglucosaminyltransferase [Oscillospiraceae bacterium]